MWELFRNGVPPKNFFILPEVKTTFREQIEQNREEELLQSAKRLAENYLEKFQKNKVLKEEIEKKALSKSISEKNLDLLKSKKHIKLDLITNKPTSRLVESMDR